MTYLWSSTAVRSCREGFRGTGCDRTRGLRSGRGQRRRPHERCRTEGARRRGLSWGWCVRTNSPRNTMAMALMFIGLSPMGTAWRPCSRSPQGRCRLSLRPARRRAAETRPATERHSDSQAFENAIIGVAASGGSTNIGVLHLLAMAREVGIPLTIEDFDVISSHTPLLADLKPGAMRQLICTALAVFLSWPSA